MPCLPKWMAIALLALAFSAGFALRAQEPPTQEAPPRYTSQEASQASRSNELPPEAKPANGQRQRGLPIEAYAVAPGTKFLVKLEGDLGTKETHENERFKVRTLEPLEAGSGIYLPAGAEIAGHISRVEPAGVAGHAKLYLTFDEVRTKFGHLPIVAEVVAVPGDHSIKAGEIREGLIEGRHGNPHEAARAAAAGAAAGPLRRCQGKREQ